MNDLGAFEQYDLDNVDDCLDLVAHYGFTNGQLREMKTKGIRYQTVNKQMRH